MFFFLAITGWWAPFGVIDWILQHTDEVDLDNEGHLITTMELILASLSSVLAGILVSCGVFLLFRYYKKKENKYPHEKRPLPATPI